MSWNDLAILFELLMCPEERAFIAALRDDPDDAATRGAYHDWLIDQLRPAAAAVVKAGHTPGVAPRPAYLPGSTIPYSGPFQGIISSGGISTYYFGQGVSSHANPGGQG